MACYHCSVKVISRSSGRSAVAAAAYRSGTRIENERDGLVHDYTRKGGVDHSEIVLPERAPARFADRSELWNAAEAAERRRDAQVAREVEVALPVEIPDREKIAVAREISAYFAAKGMVADFSVHGIDGPNPHAHIMLTMRECEGDGFAPRKNREWNDRGNAEEWRAKVAEIENRALERAGAGERVDHRSYERRGVDAVPGRHEGPAVRAIEERAERSCRRDGRPYEPATEVRASNEVARMEAARLRGEIARLEVEREEALRREQAGRAAEGERALEVENRALGERERELAEEHRVLGERYSRLRDHRGRLEERAGQLGSVAAEVRRYGSSPKAGRSQVLDRIVARCREVRGAVERAIERLRERVEPLTSRRVPVPSRAPGGLEFRSPREDARIAEASAGARAGRRRPDPAGILERDGVGSAAPSPAGDVRAAEEASRAWGCDGPWRGQPDIDDLMQSR